VWGISGRAIRARRKTSAEPYMSCTIACIVLPAVDEPFVSLIAQAALQI
jgi:hypothetical protein